MREQPWPEAEEVPRPELQGYCHRCGVHDEDADANLVVVSPTGNAHFGDAGRTLCGHDATGNDWWWPL